MIYSLIESIATAIYKNTGYPVYIDDSGSEPALPAFYLKTLDIDKETWLSNRFMIHLPIVLSFYTDDETETGDKHSIALNAMESIKLVKTDNGYIRGEDLSYRIEAGTPLTINVTYNVPMYYQPEKIPLMQKLIEKGNTKHGNQKTDE